MTQREEEIEVEFKCGDLSYLDAIEALQQFHEPKVAEEIVEGWEEDLKLAPGSKA